MTVNSLTAIFSGNRITPSYVAFMDNGDRLVGDAAKNRATINPENTVFDVKRLIGRNFSDKSVQADKKLVPYEIVSDQNKVIIDREIDGAKNDLSDRVLVETYSLPWKSLLVVRNRSTPPRRCRQ